MKYSITQNGTPLDKKLDKQAEEATALLSSLEKEINNK